MEKNLKRIRKIVFSGGGIKGLSFLGCVKALEEYNLMENITHFVGSSAGSIMSYLLVIGYDSRDLIELISCIDLSLMRDITSECIFNYFNQFGIDTGNKMMKIIEILSKKKNIDKDITFQELFSKTKKHLIITGTNLNKKKTCFFEKNNYPDMKVLEAIRISISIPYIFSVVKFEDDLYVDGSIMCNYPVNYFEDQDDLIGFLINSNNNHSDINRIDNYTIAIIDCLIKKDHNINLLLYDHVTVCLNTDIELLNFNLNLEEKQKIFDIGYQHTLKYLKSKYYRFKQDSELLKQIKYMLKQI